MLTGGASDREHIVERHRDIGDNDLPGRLGEGLTGRGSRHCPVSVRTLIHQGVGRILLVAMRYAQLTPYLPTYPNEQNAAGKKEANNLEKLDGEASEDDKKEGCRHDAD